MPTGFAVGGVVSGLAGRELVLSLNGKADLAVLANGAFTFPARLDAGAAYIVSVKTQPDTPTQRCSVDAAKGVVMAADVANVKVTCVDAFRVGGTVSGLNGSGLVLRNNTDDLLTVDADGSFTMPTPLVAGTSYEVKVLRPGIPAQSCTVNAGSGQVGNSNVGNVSVTCVPRVTRFAYVANPTGRTITTYAVDASTGELTGLGSALAGSYAEMLGIEPSGKFGYVPNYGDSTVSGFSVDAMTGALTSLGAPVATNQGAAISISFLPAGGVAYLPNLTAATISTFTINPVSGALTPVGTPVPTGAYPSELKIDSIGKFAFVMHGTPQTISGYTIDATSGALTQIPGSPFALPSRPTALAIHPNDKFIYVVQSDFTVASYAIDRATGALTQVGAPVATGWQAQDIAIDPSGQFAYVANHSQASISRYRIDGQTGALSSLGPDVATGATPASLVFDPGGRFVYLGAFTVGAIWRHAFDPVTGALGVGEVTPFSGPPLSIRFSSN